ncbi:MAG TPA: serine/threonine-protein kinase [Kofleriaceae bacterium]|jgi:serine/threonine-protein kinase|nr:serine/threonine-protein kinase [Kofleriaceae bacterium]
MGQRIGSYTVTDTLGRGGYGEVLAAVHDVIGRAVAIKVLHAKWSDDPEAVRRFVAEAQAVNAVRHPNIVDVVDFGTLDDGRHYHVMERLRGESLRARLDSRARLSIREAVPILRAVAAALDAAHDAGIVHRDVKPENVFLHEGDQVKLIDFGLAKLAKPDAAPTQTGVIIGTPAYMAPEQCRGREVDGRTDSYAFGVLAYEMLTGAVPLHGDDPVATLLAHVHETPRQPSNAAALPRAVDAVIMPLLAKVPADRPSRLGPVVDALARCEGKPLRSRSRLVWLGVGAAAAALTSGVIAVSLADGEPQRASPPPESAAVRVAPPIPSPSPTVPITVDAGVVASDAAHSKHTRISPEALENPYP